MKLGERIKQNRVDKGLTQQDLAEKMNVSRPTISNWETGRSYPDLESLVEISNLFGESLDRLLKGDEQTVRKMNLDMLKGQRLKRILAVLLVPVLLVAAYFSWMTYADRRKEIVAIEDVYNLTLNTANGLSRETEIKGTVELDRDETVLFPSVIQIEETLYFYILKSPGIKKTNEFVVSLDHHTNFDAIEKVVLLSGDEFNSPLGTTKSSYQNAPLQKVIWEKDSE